MTQDPPVRQNGAISDEALIPARLKLYPLEPYGVGGSLIESCTSWLSRLARAYRVSVFKFTPQFLSSLQENTDQRLEHVMRSTTINRVWPYRLWEINGSNEWIETSIAALESLTSGQPLRGTTMLPWSEVFSVRSHMRKRRAWCPACYRAWVRAKHEAYEPLLWAVRDVRVCPRHRQVLLSRCPHCHDHIPMLVARCDPAICVKCGGRLDIYPKGDWARRDPLDESPDDWAGFRARRTREEPVHDLWVANEIGELIATASQMIKPPASADAAQWLQAMLDQCFKGNVSALSRAAGLAGNNIVYDCLTGRRRFSLGTWLQLCRAANRAAGGHVYHLAQIATCSSSEHGAANSRDVNLYNLPRRWRGIGSRGEELAREDCQQIEAALDALIVSANDTTPRVSVIAYWLGLTVPTLKARWPSQYAALRQVEDGNNRVDS